MVLEVPESSLFSLLWMGKAGNRRLRKEVRLKACKKEWRQVGGGKMATVILASSWFRWLELGIVFSGDSGYNGYKKN